MAAGAFSVFPFHLAGVASAAQDSGWCDGVGWSLDVCNKGGESAAARLKYMSVVLIKYEKWATINEKWSTTRSEEGGQYLTCAGKE